MSFVKLREILAIKALQTERDLPTSFKEVISINFGICCNTSASVVDLTRWFLQSSLVPAFVKESTAFAWTGPERSGSLILMWKHITLSALPAAVEKFSELEKKIVLKMP